MFVSCAKRALFSFFRQRMVDRFPHLAGTRRSLAGNNDPFLGGWILSQFGHLKLYSNTGCAIIKLRCS